MIDNRPVCEICGEYMDTLEKDKRIFTLYSMIKISSWICTDCVFTLRIESERFNDDFKNNMI